MDRTVRCYRALALLALLAPPLVLAACDNSRFFDACADEDDKEAWRDKAISTRAELNREIEILLADSDCSTVKVKDIRKVARDIVKINAASKLEP